MASSEIYTLFITEDMIINLASVSGTLWGDDEVEEWETYPTETREVLKIYTIGDDIPFQLYDEEAKNFITALITYHELTYARR